jgi:hypothetical protein
VYPGGLLRSWCGEEGGGRCYCKRDVLLNFAKEFVYIVINGGLVELNNSDCVKCILVK